MFGGGGGRARMFPFDWPERRGPLSNKECLRHHVTGLGGARENLKWLTSCCPVSGWGLRRWGRSRSPRAGRPRGSRRPWRKVSDLWPEEPTAAAGRGRGPFRTGDPGELGRATNPTLRVSVGFRALCARVCVSASRVRLRAGRDRAPPERRLELGHRAPRAGDAPARGGLKTHPGRLRPLPPGGPPVRCFCLQLAQASAPTSPAVLSWGAPRREETFRCAAAGGPQGWVGAKSPREAVLSEGLSGTVRGGVGRSVVRVLKYAACTILTLGDCSGRWC